MNILIPDIWLRKHLTTEATPSEIKEYLSLCGPSIERIYGSGSTTVYDIEVTGNRPDAMSVVGVAREAATILPKFGIKATLIDDPYATTVVLPNIPDTFPLKLKTDATLNPRWMSVVFDRVTVGASPEWLKTFLELAGIRSLNNVVDVTNYLMRAYGQPAHVFDYDAIEGHQMTLRASRKGELLETLDGKTHTLPGGDIVIEDKRGRLIDLCGIMGGENSSVTASTKRVILFLQTYDPIRIRKTSMALGHRTEASGLFEKGLDAELVKPVFMRGMNLLKELTGGTPASSIIDLYPAPYANVPVRAAMAKVRSYIGDVHRDEIVRILTSLGFSPKVTSSAVTVSVPSFRRDVTIDVDIIEEIARIHGYQNIPSALPDKAPPGAIPSPELRAEEELKIRLRDWGYTELITYSMISEKLMEIFSLDTKNAYRISNPLSSEWVYLRPHLTPSVLQALKQNLRGEGVLRVFELGMTYDYRPGDIPRETPSLVVAVTGAAFFEVKGLAEAIFDQFGIPFPDGSEDPQKPLTLYAPGKYYALGRYGSVGELSRDILDALGIPVPVARLYLDLSAILADARGVKAYRPIPKYPAVVEDLSFTVPDGFRVGPVIAFMQSIDPRIVKVTVLDVHETTRTFHVTYQDESRNLTGEDVTPIRERLIRETTRAFGISLKS